MTVQIVTYFINFHVIHTHYLFCVKVSIITVVSYLELLKVHKDPLKKGAVALNGSVGHSVSLTCYTVVSEAVLPGPSSRLFSTNSLLS